ncbi:tetratricopeptide repeat protein [Kangiella koreensis]|uniref:Sel1 domain protein repeat-containing protein n=1 Tax=Kangiella koreensis (strain DSM 16069 / JCM 12317 / KCTC 12182 / SW-125) TaxID=523791 RepID=C7RAC7_KANKD|nr:sel1 repeat family protein [Kangiella koreensis]ACV26246.1 Sel1 domain protein repeat-containing protein [Kangiella koreensis DSM 16069]
MHIKKLLLTIVLLSCSSIVFGSNQEFYVINESDIAKADELFKNEQYQESQQLYSKLAKAGDKYAQYILSVVYLNGLTGEKDLQKAYAWARVAKENGNKELSKHFDHINSLISPEQKDQIVKSSSDIYRQYSNLGIAENFLSYLKDEFPKCTGSRLQVNVNACERIQVTCNINSVWGANTIPDIVSSFGKDCLEFAAKIQPENLKKMKAGIELMEEYIQEERKKGTVIISEEK